MGHLQDFFFKRTLCNFGANIYSTALNDLVQAHWLRKLRKIYGSKHPGYRLLILINSSGCAIAQQLPPHI